ncbi:uracil-DNA glycosylase family protein [Arenibacter aquaticus]|uniref:Uracil-DNA glycosylase family protein n=1 Tax=Arenibacter aquaticus TaxID=2489054 RepID=A0A3S0CJ77_9FLAO|nr:uracil-DNA glycosylase family protein [Arenibacter aquaticus]RTE52603.1 uracil-DNA glycosylase family protein [Arenibacter aquaticus]
MSQTVFHHIHPYEPFLFREATKCIVGTLPPPRFTTGELKDGDVDFCYGSRDGQLWPILDRIFGLNLSFETTEKAIKQRTDFLRQRRIGICDIVKSAQRSKIDASDPGLEHIVMRNMFAYLYEYSSIDTLLFTGGNSKNGPEYLFRKYLRQFNLNLKVVNSQVPRVHYFTLPSPGLIYGPGNQDSGYYLEERNIKTVSLTAPSGAANRAVGSLEDYKKMKKQNPEINTIDYRVLQYKKYF